MIEQGENQAKRSFVQAGRLEKARARQPMHLELEAILQTNNRLPFPVAGTQQFNILNAQVYRTQRIS